MPLKSWICLLLLFLVTMPAFSGQSVIAIVEPHDGLGAPTWVDVCLSNGYRKTEAKGFVGTVVTKTSSTNAFLVLSSKAINETTIELEALNAISGIAVYLDRMDIHKLNTSRMTAIIRVIEGACQTPEISTGIVVVAIHEGAWGTKEQRELFFNFRQSLVRSGHVCVRPHEEQLRYALNLEDLVTAHALLVPFPVIGGILPADYNLKPKTDQAVSITFYVSDTMSGNLVDEIVIADSKDIARAVRKIMALHQRSEIDPDAAPVFPAGRGQPSE